MSRPAYDHIHLAPSYPSIPCASRALITLVVTYARQHVVILLSSHKDAPIGLRSSQLRRDRTVHMEFSSSAATQLSSYCLHLRSVVI